MKHVLALSNAVLALTVLPFTVNQAAGDCTYKLKPNNTKIKATGGSGTVMVTAKHKDCDWTAVSNDSFISIMGATNGTSKGKVRYIVASNDSPNLRRGTITIGGEIFTLTQAGAKGEAESSSHASSNSSSHETAKADKSYKSGQYAANPSKVKFGEFKYVELKEVELAPEHRNNKANQESAARIDEMLLAGLRNIWPDIKVIPEGGEFAKTDNRTLQISPYITNIKIVSGGTRFWLGVMAGGSDIVMHVDYRDSSTGEIVANPDFWKGNNAWAGRWNASSDGAIRDTVVAQILGYTSGNK